MSSIFPSYQEQIEKDNTNIDVYTDIKIDITTGLPVVENGEYIVVENNEALLTWDYYALKTVKNRFLAFSSDYGNTFEELINEDVEDNVLKKKVKECLLKNIKNKSIDSVKYSFDDETGQLSLDVIITTVYGKTGGEFIV
ncbi:DUF2634 domain-containing protein [uncultured Clostridium sp.]|uniref:DUF2634 domain-containing protein n=1 Tax=uncultured Clostridium sp. TaxID=59620 RepID=UPI0025DC4DD9|nr:DUF2634 domain-containing protein [uncultured Clostridium sp.]